MGFKANRTVYKLLFDDPDMDGLIVRVRRGTIGERIEYDALTTNEDLLAFFPKLIVEWNAEDEDGVTLPITFDGVKALEKDTFNAIQRAWIRAGQAVPAPLEQPSNDGAPSLEASLPMEPLSESLAS